MNKFLMLLIAVPTWCWAADGNLQVQTTVQKEITLVNAAGESETRLVPVTTVVPGDEVIYTITFTNLGNESADTITITDPVPQQMRYIEGSAFSAGADLLFSVDGGNSWGMPGELMVTGDNGSLRLATAADYTHIRWVMRHPVGPGKRGYARFRAALR